ncbi:MAG: CDP-glycerol glycerophosphotransferase family protein [Selenomonadaceae bacterium]|nr:CDP-glycerol glycerophosphotransferase family protein [Selenomonadaceae bacterium]
MEKIDVVLIVLNRNVLDDALKNLNFNRINLAAIVMDNFDVDLFQLADKPMFFELGDEQILMASISMHQKFIKDILKTAKNYQWLICGCVNGINDIFKMKRYLMVSGVPEKNIINFEVGSQISTAWLANLRHIEEHGADFFATGNEYIQSGLNINLIPPVYANKNAARGGVILADADQDLRQGYLTAKHVFSHTKPGTIKFVLIGLAPHTFYYDNSKDFLHAPKNLQYVFALDRASSGDKRIMKLLSDDFKKFFTTVTAEQADLNFDTVKTTISNVLSAEAISDWGNAPKALTVDSFDDNVQILQNYIELCLAHGAQPVGVIFPFALATRKNYNAELLENFNETIRQFEENYGFTCIDMFDLKLDYDCFYDMTQLNEKGRAFANAMISLKLFRKGLLPTESFCDMTYDYFNRLARRAPKDEYNALMERVFNLSARRIAAKKKIRVAFLLLEAAQWCGKDIYELFMNDERLETTIFFSLDFHKDMNELVLNDFQRGIEQLRSHGVDFVAIDDINAEIPEQDIIVYLTPYLGWIPYAFRLKRITAKTLLVHIPYAFDSALHFKPFYSQSIFLVAWKIFFSSAVTFDVYKKYSVIGMPRGVYSGYPRMDVFFKPDADFKFNWKLARPDAKKIIWAPHWSIAGIAIIYSTFQWNFEFMYEFAKNHPETSWVFKPHPMLLYSAIQEGVFASVEDFEAYFQKWNDLPNAQVYTGAYYQDIFATSDALIHDCGSFSAEYQYVDKPMIYLTRDTQRHNELGKAILGVSYLVDGQDLDAIAATIQRVIIDGNDDKASARRKLFDKYLNYPKVNGMLAGEFIYRSIVDKLKEAPE